MGGSNPIRIQSMTNTATQDTEASVAQAKRIVDAGGEYVRLTAQGIKEAENLMNINIGLRQDGYMVPLVADIHFNPKVADVAAQYVEKVRQRGARLELLMAILKRERPNAKFMLLSPFLHGKKDVMAEWLGGGNTIQIDWKPAEKLLIGLKNHKTKHIDEIK